MFRINDLVEFTIHLASLHSAPYFKQIFKHQSSYCASIAAFNECCNEKIKHIYPRRGFLKFDLKYRIVAYGVSENSVHKLKVHRHLDMTFSNCASCRPLNFEHHGKYGHHSHRICGSRRGYLRRGDRSSDIQLPNDQQFTSYARRRRLPVFLTRVA